MGTASSGRIVLQANIGQYDLSQRLVANTIMTLANTDTDGSGGTNCSIFAQRSQMSGAIGDVVLQSFKPNNQFFIRRIRIASEQQAYGLKLINRGGYHISSSSQVPQKYPLSSWFQLWQNNLADNTQIQKIYESDTIPLLNEWYDVNQVVFPFGGGLQNVNTFFSGVFNLDVDFTSATSLLNLPVQLRLEIELDYPLDSVNGAPAIPPTVPKALTVFSLNHSLLTQNSAAISTWRGKYINISSQPIKSVRCLYSWCDNTGNAQLLKAYVGQGTFSGSPDVDCSVWNQLLFSGSPNLVPTGGGSVNSPECHMTDLLTLATPIAPGGAYVLSSVFGIGSLATQATSPYDNGNTPLSNLYQYTRNSSNDQGNTSGASWAYLNGQPIMVVVGYF